jgi:hypothetical protein
VRPALATGFLPGKQPVRGNQFPDSNGKTIQKNMLRKLCSRRTGNQRKSGQSAQNSGNQRNAAAIGAKQRQSAQRRGNQHKAAAIRRQHRAKR